jgi:hypothetical protein
MSFNVFITHLEPVAFTGKDRHFQLMHGLSVAGNHADDWTLPIWRGSDIEDIHWVEIGHKAGILQAAGLTGGMNGHRAAGKRL